MHMITEYLRLDADELAELRRLLAEAPDTAFDYVSGLAEAGDFFGIDEYDDQDDDDEYDDEFDDEGEGQSEDGGVAGPGTGEPADYADDGNDDGECEPRYMDTDKAWAAIEFLLAKLNPPVNVISGGRQLADREWGGGRPRLLDPAEVKAAAQFLDSVPVTQLEQLFDPGELNAAEIYPGRWDEEWVLDFVCYYYENLVDFFRAAAAADDSVLVWMS